MPEESVVIVEKHDEKYDLELSLTGSAMACRLMLLPRKGGVQLQPETVLAWLQEAKVSVGIDPAAVEECCQQALRGEMVRRQVARGVLPKPGQDAFFEFAIKPFSLEPEFSMNRKGQVDFHATHLFDNVTAGQKIAVWHPARPGVAGLSVRAEKVPAQPVQTITVKAGVGVVWQPESDCFAASQAGRVMFKNNVLSVTEEFVVDKDVDYKVGHIDFVGFVHVCGEIRDGFNVTGRKGICVDKAVGDCVLESDGDIEISTMSGHRTGTAIIRCGGDLIAHCLNNVVVECAGKVVIKKECMHSIIKSLGPVTIGGNFIGGACIALEGMEADIIGTEFGVKALLVAGIDYRLLKHTLEFQELLNEVQKLSWQILNQSGSGSRRPQLGSLSQQIAKVVQKDLELAGNGLLAENGAGPGLEVSTAQQALRTNRKINVRKKIHCGTVIFLGHLVQEVGETQTGLFSIIEHQGRELRFLKLTPLFINAAELEADLRTAETS